MKKIIIIISAAVIIVLVLGAAILFTLFSPEGYKPGDLTKKKNLESFLTPFEDFGKDNYWQVSEDISLYYTKSGRGEAVLILHGGPGFPSVDNWIGLDLLNEQYSFYYYHQRGSGFSTRPIDRFESKNYYQNMQTMLDKLSIMQQIADIERIRRILKVDKLNLIGHSFGGFIAALYAMEFPEQVSKLILVSPANMLVMPQVSENDLFSLVEENLKDDEISEYQIFMKEYFNYGKIFEKSEKELTSLNNLFGEYYLRAMKNAGKIDEIPEIKEGYDNGWMTHAIYFSLGQKYDFRKELKRISCPVLLIHGDKDMVMDLVVINTYRNNLTQSSFYSIGEAGHNSFDDQPEEFARIVGEFLNL